MQELTAKNRIEKDHGVARDLHQREIVVFSVERNCCCSGRSPTSVEARTPLVSAQAISRGSRPSTRRMKTSMGRGDCGYIEAPAWKDKDVHDEDATNTSNNACEVHDEPTTAMVIMIASSRPQQPVTAATAAPVLQNVDGLFLGCSQSASTDLP